MSSDHVLNDEAIRFVSSPVCTFCSHLHDHKPGRQTCAAFPRGIPDEIWDGKNPHTSPVEGDNGIVFQDEQKRRLQNRRGQ